MGEWEKLRMWAAAFALLAALVSPARAADPTVLSLPDAVRFALERNPELATLRQQHGIAAAAIVIARTYPFNPQYFGLVLGANGPESAGVTNKVFNEHYARIDLEMRHQGLHRRAAAEAALSRTDWEIATQETLMAIRVIRAFNVLLYRREKLRLANEAVQLQEQAVKQVGLLVEQGRLGRSDLPLARADVAEGHALRGLARTNVEQAANDLRRLLGDVELSFEVTGSLETKCPHDDAATLTQAALEARPELHALQLAVEEADARLRLEVANRCGNPSIGPGMEYNETRAYFVGAVLACPLPCFNRRQGEILQRRAERERAVLVVQQAEVAVRMDVQAALARLRNAEAQVDTIRSETLPALQTARETLDRLFAAGEPGVDLVRVLDIRRRLLRARDGYLDALWELSQARADLAAAVGTPAFAMDCVVGK
jgi:cobalt-zinc-cadmium efflux system outer membrane protein